jgi:transcriptional regulator with XRE-family HTH domain
MLNRMAGSSRSSQAIILGAAIKNAREGLGWTQRQLATAIGRENDSGVLARWESGSRKPNSDHVAQIIEALGLDGEPAATLTALAAGTDEPRALAVSAGERRQQLNAVIRAEGTASVVTYVAPLIVPGVLQTNEVIRAIMVAGEVPESEIDERVIVRIGRRNLYTRDNPAHLRVFLGECALRTVIGDRKTWIAQLRYLLELAGLSNVEISAVSYAAGWTPALTGEFELIDSDQLPSIVNVEVQGSGLLFHAREDIDRHRAAAEKLEKKAMSSNATKELIARVITELENHDDDTPHA